MTTRSMVLGIAGLAICLLTADVGFAQLRRGNNSLTFGRIPENTIPPRDRNKNPDGPPTTVEVELITDGLGTGLVGQEWAQAFESLDTPVRIRSGRSGEKAEVAESFVGRQRIVTAVGMLNRAGTVRFGDREFSLSQVEQLREFLDGLHVYGAQGSPTGQPLWGLTESQFDVVYGALTTQLEKSTYERSLRDVLSDIKPSDEINIRVTSAAVSHLGSARMLSTELVHQEVNGFTRGTALAIVLSEFGLAFHPARTPDKQLEIAVVPEGGIDKVWPIGWDFKDSRPKTAPAVFKIRDIPRIEKGFLEVLNDVSSAGQIPIRLDLAEISARNIVLDELEVKFPAKPSTLFHVLKSATVPHRLEAEYRIDEGGQPFVWITPIDFSLPDQ